MWEFIEVIGFGAGATFFMPLLMALPSKTIWGVFTGALAGVFVVFFIPLSGGVPIPRFVINGATTFAIVSAVAVYSAKRLWTWGRKRSRSHPPPIASEGAKAWSKLDLFGLMLWPSLLASVFYWHVEASVDHWRLWAAGYEDTRSPEAKAAIGNAKKIERNFERYLAKSKAEAVDAEVVVAAMKGEATSLEQLLKAGRSPNAKDAVGMTALYWAVVFGDPKIVAILVKAGADPNVASGLAQRTALQQAVRTRIGANVRLLLEHGADPNKGDGRGRTALQQIPLPESPILGVDKKDLAPSSDQEIAALLREYGGR